MEKEQKYKKIAELLLGRLIVLQREFNNIAETIEESGERNNIRMCIEVGDFIPLIKFSETLGLANEEDEVEMYDEIDDIIENNQEIDSQVENFFEKYI
ncbi:MAG: hypothetical protein ACI4VP_01450 [Clostridia bacterium]